MSEPIIINETVIDFRDETRRDLVELFADAGDDVVTVHAEDADGAVALLLTSAEMRALAMALLAAADTLDEQ